MTPGRFPDDRAALAACALLAALALLALVGAYGRCAAWRVDAPPAARCGR